MLEIDKLDREILNLLHSDGRMSAAEIARQVAGGSERSVRYRIERMRQAGLLKISAVLNPQALGFTVIADVFIEVEAGQIMPVAHALARLEKVSYVACSIGETDISAQVVAHDTAEVYAFVTEVIGALPGVRKTTTSIVPIVIKDIYEWQIPEETIARRTAA